MPLVAFVIEQIESEVNPLLIENEKTEKLYRLWDDYLAITNLRLIYVDKQWISSKKAIHSIPIESIKAISLRRGGLLSFTRDVEILVGSKEVELKFDDSEDAKDFYQRMTIKILS